MNKLISKRRYKKTLWNFKKKDAIKRRYGAKLRNELKKDVIKRRYGNFVKKTV